MRRLFNYTRSNFQHFDLFGVPAQLYINKGTLLKTSFGAFISFIVIGLIFFVVVGFCISWLDFSMVKIVTGEKYLSTIEVLWGNKSYEYDLNRQNFYFYYYPQIVFPNQTVIYYANTLRYLNYQWIYLNKEDKECVLEDDPLVFVDVDIFLGLPQSKIDADQGIINPDRRGFTNRSLTMGLFPDIKSSRTVTPSFAIQIYPCHNSTVNNNSCASYDEIEEILEYVVITIGAPKTIYDFSGEQLFSRVYDYQTYYLSRDSSFWYTNNLQPEFYIQMWDSFLKIIN